MSGLTKFKESLVYKESDVGPFFAEHMSYLKKGDYSSFAIFLHQKTIKGSLALDSVMKKSGEYEMTASTGEKGKKVLFSIKVKA